MHPLVLAVISGVFFGTWQLISRGNTSTPLILNIGMSVGALVATAIYGGFAMKQAEWQSLAAPNVISLPLLCGILNGIGFLFFLTALQRSPTLTTPSITSMMVMIGFVAVGSILFFSEQVTLEKLLGICFAVAAVYLLSK